MKKLGLIVAALTLALLCAACATDAATPQNEQSGEADAAESADLQKTAETDLQEGDMMSNGLTLTNEWDKVFLQSDNVNHHTRRLTPNSQEAAF